MNQVFVVEAGSLRAMSSYVMYVGRRIERVSRTR